MEPSLQLLGDFHRSLFAQGAFPDGRDSPPGFEQFVLVASVPFDVRIELGSPESLARGRRSRVRAAGVAVPEASVH